MENKKQDVNSLQELVKEANAYSGWFANLANELSKVLDDIQTSKKEEDTWEMKCPYENGDKYFALSHRRSIIETTWDNHFVDEERFKLGNVFPTREAAELEAKRRNLLTRFRAFRDECNRGLSVQDEKWEIDYKDKKLKSLWVPNSINGFPTFGYFKNREDAERAIELFGDEIKELFVEGEED